MLFVAAIAILCAYHVNWIHQRHAFLADHAVDALHFDMFTDMNAHWLSQPWVSEKPPGEGYSWTGTLRKPKHTFNLLWLFGEQSHDYVKLVYRSNSMPTKFLGMRWGGEGWALQSIPVAEADLAKRLFPEAYIRYVVYGVEPRNW
jgi:hypothetical protein